MGNKVQVGPERIRPKQDVNLMRGYGEEGVRWRWSQFCSIVRGYEHMEHGGLSQTWTYYVKGEIVRNCDVEYIVKVDKTSKIKERTCTRICAHYQSTNIGYSRLVSWISLTSRLGHCIVD